MAMAFPPPSIHDILQSMSLRRIPLTSTNWPNMLLPALINFVLAFLSRWPDTRLLRLLLLPVSVFCSIHTGSYYLATRGCLIYNLTIGFLSLTQFAQALDLAFSTTDLIKVSKDNQLKSEKDTLKEEKNTFSDALLEANELLSTSRGFGFEYGKSIPLPHEHRPLLKGPFLIKTFFMFLQSYVTFDIIEFILKLTPPFRTPEGGSMYVPDLPFLQRSILALMIHVFTGIFIIETMQAGYYLATLVFVGIFNQSPSLWSPIFDQPWKSESIQQLWGRRWHQMLRRTFLVAGGFPCEWLGQKIGLGRSSLLFGTFLASGLFHEVPFYIVTGHFNWRALSYFVFQAFLIFLEHAWTAITGRKVRGRWGRLWVYFVMLILAQFLVNTWQMRGALSGRVVHGKLSPCRRLILPLLNAQFGLNLYIEPGF